jgi:hypothetical protein
MRRAYLIYPALVFVSISQGRAAPENQRQTYAAAIWCPDLISLQRSNFGSKQAAEQWAGSFHYATEHGLPLPPMIDPRAGLSAGCSLLKAGETFQILSYSGNYNEYLRVRGSNGDGFMNSSDLPSH